MEEETGKDNKNLENEEINIEEKEMNIDNEKEIIETEIKKEIISIKEKEGLLMEKAEITNIKLKEMDENRDQNGKDKNIKNLNEETFKEIEQKFEGLIEKQNIDVIKKEKIEEIKEEMQKLKDEEIKNIKLIPRQELIIVVIHNITPNVTEAHLKEIFSNYGEVKEVYIPINKETLLKKNYAFIEFTKKENAEKAQLYLDEGQIDGKVVRVEILSQKNYIEKQ